ncbi:MAG TPA: VWA domain-containing protein [Vicinamibacteria bacterium]|nr:VWA domain-containing protein [Vicinamibacteria bacterium]
MRDRTSRTSVCSLLALAAGLTAATAFAEDPRPPDIVFPSRLEEVHLTVTVRDSAGRLVSNLRPEDFTVLENGRPQTVEVFGRAVEPGQEEVLALDLGLLMDTSASMLQQLRLSQEAAVRFLESIPRARDLVTIFFDDDIRLSRYNSENQQGLYERIAESKGGGNTALYDAISVYLSRVQDSSGRKVLVLFTDGEDSRSALGLGDILELIRASRVTIYPIAFTGGFSPGSARALRSKSVLQQMAELTGGQVFTPRSSKDLAVIYRRILQELRAHYVLGYVSDDLTRDGKFRRVKVNVTNKALRVRHRAGYYAPS